MCKWRNLIATSLTIVMLVSGAVVAQSEKTPPPTQEQSGQAEPPPDEQQDIKHRQEDPPPDQNIRATRPEAQSVWEFMSQYTGSDKVTRLINSFSNGQINVMGGGWCSGVMVSPHIFMTAAHCGGPEWTGHVRFFRIDEDGTPGNAAQSQSAEYYAQTFPWQAFTSNNVQHSDIILWWVEDGTDGIPPGVKYGYLELSTETPAVGDAVYSFWVNPVDNFNGSALSPTLLHSSGSVIQPNPGLPNFSDDNLYMKGGASGSALVGTGRHGHQVVGVTATGPWVNEVFPGTGEGFGRRWANVRYLLDNFDADHNDVVDAIEYDLFYTRAPRNFYELRFDTPLRRAQWRRAGAGAAPGGPSSVTNAPGFWTGHVVGSAGQETNDGLWHATARFQPGATYRISLLVYGVSTDASPSYIKLRSDTGRTDALLTFTPTVGAWRRLTFRVALGNHRDYRMILGELFGGQYYVGSIAIVRESASLDFESGDERRSWEYTGRAYVTSVGVGGSNDFSGMVNGTSEARWGLRNRNVALRANHTYDISFDAKHVSGPLSAINFLSVENLSGVVARDLPWTFSAVGETRRLTLTVNTGNEMGNTITFGTLHRDGKYMVDNIKMVER